LVFGVVDQVVGKGEQPLWIVSDDLWVCSQSLLPVVPWRTDHSGRNRLDDRKALCGILFVLYTAIPWKFLPRELGFGSGMTCRWWLRDWNGAGVWQRPHEVAAGRVERRRRVLGGSGK
jgi:transposase